MATVHHSVKATRIEGGWRFVCEETRSRLGGLLSGSTRLVPVSEWDAIADPDVGIRELLAMPSLRSFEDRIEVPDDAISSWDGSSVQVRSCGLPPPCPFRMSVSSDRGIGQEGGRLRIRWEDADNVVVSDVRVQGTLIQGNGRKYLLRDPLAGVVRLVRESMSTSDRIAALGRIKASLSSPGDKVSLDRELSTLVVYQATAVGIQTTHDREGYHFEPILLTDEVRLDADDGSELRRMGLLKAASERKRFQKFLKDQAALSDEVPSSFKVANDVYVVLDPGVRAAIRRIGIVSRGDRDLRQSFFENKMSHLVQDLEDAGSDGSVVEYSDRVIGLCRWEGSSGRSSSSSGNGWFPDEDATTYVIRDADGKCLHVPVDRVADTLELIQAAFERGDGEVVVDRESYRLDENMANQCASVPIVARPEAGPSKGIKEKSLGGGFYFLRTRGNREDLEYVERRDSERTAFNADLGLLRVPFDHQEKGIDWMRMSYLMGMKGLLMADDMGVGKTFQVLSFLRWLHLFQARKGNRRPVMIVAPKSLLGNWEDECEQSVGKGGLGDRVVRLYGENVRKYKISGSKDISVGQSVLDIGLLKESDWVLTTYETMRDYHVSLAAVGFEIVVFDEAQKIKDSESMVTEASRSLKTSAMRILMTGTPVETSLMNLWTLMDVAWPGRLGMSAKEFDKAYISQESPDISPLKALLSESAREGDIVLPPLMMRRMKEDVADLKPKHFRSMTVTMPPRQAEEYSRAIALQKSNALPPLKALQRIRDISLHPNLSEAFDESDPRSVSAFISQSARMISLFDRLDYIEKRGERALVFVDLHRCQSILQRIIRHRYSLSRFPDVISGKTSLAQRDVIRHRFQAGSGFDALILGPKAAGFGLTLHSANHVLHLNRWWNPAVEDQCTDRAYRIGQERDVWVWLPVARHPEFGDASYDVVLDRLLEKRRATSREIIVPTCFSSSDLAAMQSMMFSRKNSDLDLAGMDWRRFELWVAEEVRKRGHKVSQTPSSGDHGADVVADVGGVRILLQVKHRSSGANGVVGSNDVLDILRSRTRYGASSPLLACITNGTFDADANRVAAREGIRLVDASSIGEIGAVVSSMAA